MRIRTAVRDTRESAVTALKPTTFGGMGREAYALICSRDGMTAREIARELGVTRKEVNQMLYAYPFIRDLCYHDDEYRWHGLIRQGFPHDGLFDYCGWYGFAYEFLEQGEGEWLSRLEEGCKRIGRNLNDTRGLIHSFTDSREVMRGLFGDLEEYGVDYSNWELCFELRIKRAKWVRIYADVLVITPVHAFSLEFKMKDEGDQGEIDQAAKYAPYLQVVLGLRFDVVPALVLTRASETYDYVASSTGTQVAIASPDMLFNVFDEKMSFLD